MWRIHEIYMASGNYVNQSFFENFQIGSNWIQAESDKNVEYLWSYWTVKLVFVNIWEHSRDKTGIMRLWPSYAQTDKKECGSEIFSFAF